MAGINPAMTNVSSAKTARKVKTREALNAKLTF
jgi:hypothetical protein